MSSAPAQSLRARVAALAAVAAQVAAATVAANTGLGSEYLFPVVRGFTGPGGAEFTTEVCFDNPVADSDRILNVGMFGNGGVMASAVFILAANEIVCTEDVVRDLLGARGSGYLYIYAEDEPKNVTDDLGWVASAKNHRITPAGTYLSCEVPPTNDAYGGLVNSQETAYFTGIHNHSGPNRTGFRARISVASTTSERQGIEIRVEDASGNIVLHLPSFQVRGFALREFFLPLSLDLADGRVVVSGGHGIVPVVAISDLRVGDSVERSLILDSPATKGDRSDLFAELRTRLHRELVGRVPVPLREAARGAASSRPSR